MSGIELEVRRGGLVNGDRKPLITRKFLRRWKEDNMKKFLKIFFVLLLASPVSAEIHSVSTNFSDVIMADMKPGMVYSLKKEKNLPYTILNYAENSMEIEVTVEKPSKSALKENYEPLPDASWITVFPSKFKLEPGEKMGCDLIISIPPDEKYANRHYQAMIVAESIGKPGTGGGVGINFALASRLRFSTGPRPETVFAEYRQRIFAALKLEMSPMSLFIRKQIPVGKKAKFNGIDFETAQVVNKGKKAYKLELQLEAKPKEYGLNPEYEALPEEIKVTFKNKKVKTKPRSIQDIEMEIEVPDEEEFYGKSYAFVVIGKVLGFDIPIEIFSRVYFKTEEKK